jgi:DNA-binding IclR family transcriptional regulator
MTSLEKMLGLLDVFTRAAPVWSTEDLIRYANVSPSTCYRYLKTLHKAGLLARVANGSYVLGPRILELDRTTRLADPVYVAGGPVIARLAEKTRCSALLCILYSDKVMCVREALAPGAPPELFSRGQQRPLFSGATAKAILAWLPAHQLRSLFAKHRKTIAAAGLGSDWDSFRKSLRQIRDDGYALTVGEFNPGIAAIAAPLFNRAGDVLGSLAIATSAAKLNLTKFRTQSGEVIAAAREATQRIASAQNMMDLPARAVG